ncbi:MAG: DUF177 domain-containing protein [Blastocatellia bacterium]|nr:DUF177 domain-containing protein [Blastocatellia bacterium]
MIINVNQIVEDKGLTIHHLYPEGEPDLASEDSRIAGRSILDLRIAREGDRVKIRGSISSQVQFFCDRCLAPLSIPVDQNFDLLYIPPIGARAPDEEMEIDPDDLSVGFYQGQTIDLDDLVREQIELALPMARLCGEECRGLCPDCGANLNHEECACAVEQIDPRWAALKELKSGN